jgi:Protein of unknown function (DUF4127)
LKIGLVPIDDRPVNTKLPAMIAAVAGIKSIQPPREILGREHEPGHPVGIGNWILETAAGLDALVLSFEMVAYGGLIASRTTSDSPLAALERLAPLSSFEGNRPRLYGSSIILRASDSYSTAEEPPYWADYGRELHAFGGALHRSFRSTEDADISRLRDAVPPGIRGDFLRRRIRNHIVNLEALRLAAAGALQVLLLTSDDTAVHSAGSLEQEWLEHWANAIDCGERVLIYSGADEIGSVLTARSLAADHEPVRFRVRCLEADGLERIPKFENAPLHRTIERQILAAGGRLAAEGEPSDVVLVVHAPSPDEADWYGDSPSAPRDETIVAAVAAEVAELIEGGSSAVALADLRYTNGADPWLVDALRQRSDLLALSAYAGWNTAANSLGTVVAHATAVVRGRQDGTFDAVAHRRLLAHRFLEDCAYQAMVRSSLDGGDENVCSVIAMRLQAEAARLFPQVAIEIPADAVRLPWERLFEVDFAVEGIA